MITTIIKFHAAVVIYKSLLLHLMLIVISSPNFVYIISNFFFLLVPRRRKVSYYVYKIVRYYDVIYDKAYYYSQDLLSLHTWLVIILFEWLIVIKVLTIQISNVTSIKRVFFSLLLFWEEQTKRLLFSHKFA